MEAELEVSFSPSSDCHSADDPFSGFRLAGAPERRSLHVPGAFLQD